MPPAQSAKLARPVDLPRPRSRRPRLAAALQNQQVRLRELPVARQQPKERDFPLAVPVSTSSRRVTESYRAAPFQGWSVSLSPTPRAPARLKNPQAGNCRPGWHEPSLRHRAGITTPPSRDQAEDLNPESEANQARIRSGIRLRETPPDRRAGTRLNRERIASPNRQG